MALDRAFSLDFFSFKKICPSVRLTIASFDALIAPLDVTVSAAFLDFPKRRGFGGNATIASSLIDI